MKKLFTLCLFLVFLSCNKDSGPVADCGCENPQKDLPWLKELIDKANTDDTGNYKGTIWLLNYKGARHVCNRYDDGERRNSLSFLRLQRKENRLGKYER